MAGEIHPHGVGELSPSETSRHLALGPPSTGAGDARVESGDNGGQGMRDRRLS